MDKQPEYVRGKTVTEQTLHVGSFLRAFIDKHRLSLAALARYIEMDPAQLQRTLKKKDVKVSFLYKFSDAFQHNFFGDLAQTLPSHFIYADPDTTPQKRISELEEQLKIITAERDLLKELISR